MRDYGKVGTVVVDYRTDIADGDSVDRPGVHTAFQAAE